MREVKSVKYYLEKYPNVTVPSIEHLLEWSNEGDCYTPAGAWVEADGWDEYGNPSWFLILGMI